MITASYAATERLRNGSALHIRALLPSDRTEMLAAVGTVQQADVYRRSLPPRAASANARWSSSSTSTSSATWHWWRC